jgi:hypothetical protein
VVEIRNINAWKRKTEAMRNRVKATATEHVRTQAFRLFKFVVDRTPQYSGDLVSNWNLETNQTGPASYRLHPNKGKIDGIGGWHAVATSAEFKRNAADPILRARTVVSSIKWNTNVRLVNVSPTAQELTYEGPIKFRPSNMDLVKDSSTVLGSGQWNLRAVAITRFKYLGATL